ncbi:hypothetical protein KC340_g10430 [Hortaea werneckii]|nr:hypothetical protein KC342_g10676 [Hortaea werneckii]KAI7092682.1 hypothetical protein KC339_g12318 [Hortaea werneckii]KAI7231210.1 hypothetical protein KC365_g7288 [Hortaea werneckii]KAI7310632.1 hypothetical protein KC340_g10430 [Hortaea werneckii]KAI7399631.1 hypothetical protein KC328_g3943 [Hortaea werneckii]
MAQDRRGLIIPLLIIGFIFFSPDPIQSPPRRFRQQPTIEDAIADEQRSLGVLQASSYGDFPNHNALNLSGLEANRSYAWDALPKVKERATWQLEYALGDTGHAALEGQSLDPAIALYHNVTGFLHGQWVRSKIQEEVPIPQLNLTDYAPPNPFHRPRPRFFDRNITGNEGELSVRFREREQPIHYEAAPDAYNATGIGADISLKDASNGNEHELQVQGVYLPSLGQAIMTTTSSKHAGIFMLPHFALSESTFNEAKALLNDSISRVIELQQDRDLISLNPWAANMEGSGPDAFENPSCELIVYLQQHPASGLPASAPSTTILAFLERELRFPSGAFLPSAPEMRFSMLAFSPDCGYVLESKGEPDFVPQEGRHLYGPKIEALYGNGRHHLLVFTLALGVQIILLKRQMREASTPSTRSRISFYTIAMLSLGDGFTTMTFLLISLFVTGLWVNLMGTAFLAFVSVSFFGMRFILDIWTVQAPERARRAREEAEEERQRHERLVAAVQRYQSERRSRTGAPPANTDQPTATERTQATPGEGGGNINSTTPAAPQAAPQTTPGSLPLPVTAQRPTDTGATPVFMPSDQEGLESVGDTQTTTQAGAQPEPQTSSFGSLYTKFYLLLLATLFISLNAASWPAEIRRVYFTILGLIYFSFWIPQINRNVQRNCRHALNWEFVLGQSVLRLVPFAYFYGYEHNVLFAKRDYYSLAILAVWVWIQVVILGSQELIGPRWFVRKDWAPPAYDYHPVLREDEEGATMPIGFSEATAGSAPSSPLAERRASLGSPTAARRGSMPKESKQKGKRMFDCAICMQDLEVPIVEAGGASDNTLAGGLLARRNYMVTPCRHIFHSACLEGWMKYRLQCPICRETLPPL